jgi:fermentation-respiration switch protein FrsA (DUF1100 family)
VVGAALLRGTTIIAGNATLAAETRPLNQATGAVTFGPTSATILTISAAGAPRVTATGTMTLAGTLKIMLLDDSLAIAGSAFDFFDWDIVSGRFQSVELPTLASHLVWNASDLGSTGRLSVELAGDFDRDLDVDGDDFIAWQRGISPVPVSSIDLNTWRARFRRASANSTLLLVPEPLTTIHFILFAAGSFCLTLQRLSGFRPIRGPSALPLPKRAPFAEISGHRSGFSDSATHG